MPTVAWKVILGQSPQNHKVFCNDVDITHLIREVRIVATSSGAPRLELTAAHFTMSATLEAAISAQILPKPGIFTRIWQRIRNLISGHV